MHGATLASALLTVHRPRVEPAAVWRRRSRERCVRKRRHRAGRPTSPPCPSADHPGGGQVPSTRVARQPPRALCRSTTIVAVAPCAVAFWMPSVIASLIPDGPKVEARTDCISIVGPAAGMLADEGAKSVRKGSPPVSPPAARSSRSASLAPTGSKAKVDSAMRFSASRSSASARSARTLNRSPLSSCRPVIRIGGSQLKCPSAKGQRRAALATTAQIAAIASRAPRPRRRDVDLEGTTMTIGDDRLCRSRSRARLRPTISKLSSSTLHEAQPARWSPISAARAGDSSPCKKASRSSLTSAHSAMFAGVPDKALVQLEQSAMQSRSDRPRRQTGYVHDLGVVEIQEEAQCHHYPPVGVKP